jgi:CheY-like chemotaxis protein
MLVPEPPHVLLVEDEPAVARALARWLRRNGLHVEVCGSPVIALERVVAGERFDVVVCDGQMPDLDCVAFYVRASASWPGLSSRIIFLSGGVPDDARRFIVERGLPFFAKPLAGRAEIEELIAVIRFLAGSGDPPAPDWRKRHVPR